MTKEEALKMALEALEEAWYHVGTFQPTEKAIDLYDEARTAIKEALAQSEKYPQIAINPEIVGYVAPQRKPLTDEQRFDLLTKFEPYKNKWGAPAILIDMVEAAHGIKE